MTARLYRLTEIHQRIDNELRREEKRRLPDWMRLAQLKKMKLRAKDLMAQLTSSRR